LRDRFKIPFFFDSAESSLSIRFNRARVRPEGGVDEKFVRQAFS